MDGFPVHFSRRDRFFRCDNKTAWFTTALGTKTTSDFRTVDRKRYCTYYTCFFIIVLNVREVRLLSETVMFVPYRCPVPRSTTLWPLEDDSTNGMLVMWCEFSKIICARCCCVVFFWYWTSRVINICRTRHWIQLDLCIIIYLYNLNISINIEYFEL